MSEEYDKIQEMLKMESDRQKSGNDLDKKTELTLILKEVAILAPITIIVIALVGLFFSTTGDQSFWEGSSAAAFAVGGLCVGWIIWSYRIGYGNFAAEMTRRAWTNDNENKGVMQDLKNTLSFGGFVYVSLFTSIIYLIVYYSFISAEI